MGELLAASLPRLLPAAGAALAARLAAPLGLPWFFHLLRLARRYEEKGHPVWFAGLRDGAPFDLDIGSRYVFPYFGFGIGYQWTVFHNLRVDTPALGTTLGLSGEGSNPAGQGIVGLSFPVPGLVGLSITTEYRFLGMIGPESASAEITRGGSGPQARGYQEISDTLNQTFLLGIRYAFSVKPPASLGTSAGGAP